MLTDLWIRLRSLLRRGTVESEMEDELRFHSEHQLEKYLKEGLSRDEAARRVRMMFGGMEQVREDCREARGVSLVEDLVEDFRYGWRTLLKSPGFALTALSTIALGIGANTALFSVIYSVLLSPLPFKDASRLIQLNEVTPQVGDVSVSYPNFEDWRAASRTLSQMAAVVPTAFNLAGIRQPEYIRGFGCFARISLHDRCAPCHRTPLYFGRGKTRHAARAAAELLALAIAFRSGPECDRKNGAAGQPGFHNYRCAAVELSLD